MENQTAVIAGSGVEGKLLAYVVSADIQKAKSLFTDNSDAVMEAITEYDTASHKVMFRKNKQVTGKEPYITEKLPRSWQKHINEVALYFLLNNPIKWTCKSDNDKEFELFNEFLESIRFNTTMRQAKRLAGAETHSAKLYHLYQEDNKPKVKCLVLSKSLGYDLYPMIDQWGTMIAFGVGYFLKEEAVSVEHFDIYTPSVIYRCKKDKGLWSVVPVSNPTGKINIIYYQQSKEWDGSQERIERDEMQDSKSADTNNYFADPIAIVTAGIINSLPDVQSVGKLLQAQSREDSLTYVEPPSSNELKESEKKTNMQAIQTDTFTPPFDFQSLSGLGVLSGEALKKILLPAYIKRNNNIEIYDIAVDREKSVILSVLGILYPKKKAAFDSIIIKHEFQEPFNEDKLATTTMLSNAVSAGIMSVDTAVPLLGLVDDNVAEIARIKADLAQKVKEPIQLQK